MAEVLFYEHPVPLNRSEHKELRLKGIPNVKFAMNTHSVPLTGAEFAVAARDLLIVFAGNDVNDAGPIALLGLRKDENLFVDSEGRWEEGVYIPAFVRRYPFVLAEKPTNAGATAATDADDQLTVFLDEQYEGFSKTEGERLFKDDGTDTDLLTNAVKFLGEFQQNIVRTRWFMQQLSAHDLLEPRNVSLRKEGKDGEEGRSINLNGLFVVNEEKLRALDDKVAAEFAREGVYGWIYAHLVSLANIDRLAHRLERRELVEAANTTKN